MTDVIAYMKQLGQQATQAAKEIAAAKVKVKNAALLAIADNIQASAKQLKAENKKDLDAGKEKGLEPALLDRLELNDKTIAGMAEGLRQIAALPDPIGEVSGLNYRPSGIQVGKMRVPLGVIGIIYESRPNVTADAAGLCLKSGNAVVLRGGSEAIHSNLAVAKCIDNGLKTAGLPSACVQVVETTDRAAVGQLLAMPEYVDVIIPRGGKSLIERISKESTVPVIKHLDGICHVYLDKDADKDKALDIAFNSKTHRYGVCNAMETLLVHEEVAQQLIPPLFKKYRAEKVELRGCDKVIAIDSDVKLASDEDWDTEYLAPVLSVKIVGSLDEAINHIAEHSSAHTESIVTENYSTANRFVREVDSSSVMVNASTRFADGFEYGLGAEIGISTDKLHARGPVGLEGLTTQKYVVYGDGHIRH